MKQIVSYCGLALTALGAFLLSAQGNAQPESSVALPALSMIQPGQWEFRSTDDASANQSFCVIDARVLLQMRHKGVQCSRYVITSGAKEATVHYSCPNAGNGRTTVRVETPRLVQVQSQGIAENAPFSFSAEGRRTGACAATLSRLQR